MEAVKKIKDGSLKFFKVDKCIVTLLYLKFNLLLYPKKANQSLILNCITPTCCKGVKLSASAEQFASLIDARFGHYGDTVMYDPYEASPLKLVKYSTSLCFVM